MVAEPVENGQFHHMGPRPTFTPEIGAAICAELETGKTLRDVCRREDFPSEAAVRRWAMLDEGGVFAAQYSRAREIGYHAMADEVLEIADDGSNDWMERTRTDGSTEEVFNSEHFQRSKLRYEARRWLLSKCLPKIYGDKVALTGAEGGPLQVVVQKFSDEPESGS